MIILRRISFILLVHLISDALKATSFRRIVHRIQSNRRMVCASIESQQSVLDKGSDNSKKWEVDLLYDSECPICMMEVKFLQKRDIEGKIKFTDISSPDYNPAEHGNVQFADGMRKIRAVLPDDSVVVGVEVFRQTYKAIGLGWVFEATNIPIIGRVADSLYDIWAENRLRITGRGDMADALSKQAQELRSMGEVDCDSDACEIDYEI